MAVLLKGTFVFWFAALICAIAALFLFHDILLPFGFGLVLAFMLDPLVDRVQLLGLSRGISTLAIFCGLILMFVLILLLLIPLLADQLAEFIKSLPAILKALQDYAAELATKLRGALGPQLAAKLQGMQSPLDPFFRDAAVVSATFIGSVWAGGQAILNTISFFVVAPLVTAYMLNDWDRMVAHIDKYLPRRDVSQIRTMAREMNDILASYLRGQALICLLLGVIYSAGLTAMGLNFSLLIGLAAGFIAFIPYVGNIFGLGTALLVAFAQFGPEFAPLAGVCAVFSVGQFVDGYILQPRVMGPAIGLHPVWVIFALYAFGSLFGFVGVLLAVPMAACIGVLLSHVLHFYKNTQLYKEKSRV
jgi:predicted PurR-regulated permease PerM